MGWGAGEDVVAAGTAGDAGDAGDGGVNGAAATVGAVPGAGNGNPVGAVIATGGCCGSAAGAPLPLHHHTIAASSSRTEAATIQGSGERGAGASARCVVGPP